MTPASASLLGYVSGITPSLAKNIVAYREENGAFTDRRQLKKVPKLGPKAYLNAAGFLRISGGKNPLDATSVHPESYEVATAVLERAGVKASELSRGGVPDIERRLGSISALASDLDCGTLTLIDIVNELKKPGRDPRDDAPEVVFSRSALSIDDLEPGMELKGTEVKSMRQGRMNLKESFAIVKDGEVLVCGMHISPYEQGNIFNTDPLRQKKLLLHKSQIRHLAQEVGKMGYSLIPLQVYLKDGRFKMELGLCKGKKLHDKRDDMAAKDAQRDIQRALRSKNRGDD